MDTAFWRKCSTCKTPMGFKQAYQRCNVSTCNQARVSLVFCSVSCWSAHVPVYRHKDAWALEEISPSAEEWAAQQGSAPTPASTPAPASAGGTVRVVRPPVAASAPALGQASTDDILVVASKLKDYIRKRSEMNTSAEVMETLSDKLRALCDAAIASARADGRKTVMSRDF
jgi:hypothetical protein